MCEDSNNTITRFKVRAAPGKETAHPLLSTVHKCSCESSYTTVNNWAAYNSSQNPQMRLLKRMKIEKLKKLSL